MYNNVGTAFTNPSIISNCTGLVRGLERGIERVIGPLNILAYVEIEAFAVANMVAQMESGLLAPRPIWTNLKTFPARHFHGKVHGITGGYPCQPFSCAGQRQGTDDPRHLWPFIEWQMSAIRPIWGFFENVGDHLSLGFDTVYRSLRRMGYRVEAGIYTAEEAGAPHERERLFILAVVDDPEIRTIGINFYNQWATDRNEYESGHSGKALANAAGFSQREPTDKAHAKPNEGRTRDEFIDRRQPVAYAQPFGIVQGSKEHKSKQSDPDGIQRRDRQSLADSGGQGLEEWREQPARQEQPPTERSGNTDFPAKPGAPPHDWEAPRVIESGMGCTIDGYNFREDLLRGLGNGVVEQTAEIAFRDLLRKHGLLNH